MKSRWRHPPGKKIFRVRLLNRRSAAKRTKKFHPSVTREGYMRDIASEFVIADPRFAPYAPTLWRTPHFRAVRRGERALCRFSCHSVTARTRLFVSDSVAQPQRGECGEATRARQCLKPRVGSTYSIGVSRFAALSVLVCRGEAAFRGRKTKLHLALESCYSTASK